MMKRLYVPLAILLCCAPVLAGQMNDDDQRLVAQAAADRGQDPPVAKPMVEPVAPPVEPAPPTGMMSDEEQEARTEATLAAARLELVLARKALQAERYEEAARKAQRVLALLQQLPLDVDASEYGLQADGILARAARKGVNVDRLPPAPAQAGDVPPPIEDPRLDRKVREAARMARNYQGADTPDIHTRGDERVLRERALRQLVMDRYGYRPSQGIIDMETLQLREEERVYYQAALRGAYQDSEARELVAADEARVTPEGVISYPDDWPDKMRKRAQYQGGMIARTPSWQDDDGREWYVAIYDIHDLIYVPPDFGTGWQWNPLVRDQYLMDREALRWQSRIFRGTAADLAAGIPLLRYFGGVDDWAYRGPKYSVERQAEIIQMIEAFTSRIDGEQGKLIPIAPMEQR